MKTLTAKELALYLGCEAEFFITDQGVNLTRVREITLSRLRLYKDKDFYGYIKPILRPLSDITEEEARQVYRLHWGFTDNQMLNWERDYNTRDYKTWLINVQLYNTRGFNGNANTWTYLLSRGFDLFNWIEQGLAISKPAIEIEADTK